MKVNIWILLFVFIPNLIYGQSYLEYYEGINLSRVLASDSNAKEAIKNYYSTFENFNFVFARDCYNAIELSAFVKDTIKLNYFIRRGISQGLNFNRLLEIKDVAEFRNSTFLSEISAEKDSLEALYKSSINTELREEICKMFRRDQSLREKYYQAKLFKRKKIGNEWEDLNSRQVERLMEITRTYGFPGEKLIGIDTEEMHPKVNDRNISSAMPIVIFIHHYSQPNKTFSLELLEQIELGNLHNEHFATIADFEAKFGRNRNENLEFFAFKQFPKVMHAEEIDKKRQDIGMLSISEYKRLASITSMTKFWQRLY